MSLTLSKVPGRTSVSRQSLQKHLGGREQRIRHPEKPIPEGRDAVLTRAVDDPISCSPAAAGIFTKDDHRAATTHGTIRLVAIFIVAIQRLREVLLQTEGVPDGMEEADLLQVEVRCQQNGPSKADHRH